LEVAHAPDFAACNLTRPSSTQGAAVLYMAPHPERQRHQLTVAIQHFKRNARLAASNQPVIVYFNTDAHREHGFSN
jgi:hypothetical protein